MDQFYTMSSTLTDEYGVMEALERFDIMMDDVMGVAMESVKTDAMNIQQGATATISLYSNRYIKAMKGEDFATAREALNGMKDYLTDAMSELKNITPDKYAFAKAAVKGALTVGLIAAAVNPVGASRTLTNIIVKLAPKAAQANIKSAVRRAVGIFTISVPGQTLFGQALGLLMTTIITGTKKSFVKKYGADPNAGNAFYRQAYASVATALETIPELHKEVDEVEKGTKPNPFKK